MKGVKHYLRDGTLYSGKTHKHSDGTVTAKEIEMNESGPKAPEIFGE